MMTCREVTELMTDALEGQLAPAKRSSFAFHMRVCPFCRTHRKQIEVTVETLRSLPDPEPSDAARAHAIAAFRARVRARC